MSVSRVLALLAAGIATLACGNALQVAGSSTAPPADPCHQNGVEQCVLNPNITPETIAATICHAGWTKTVRPPLSYTNPLKARQLAMLNHPGWTMANTEEDHRLPLEMGGDPKAEHNLSPEFADAATPSRPVANHKDDAENAGRRAICDQHRPLREVQAEFVRMWLAAWPGYL